MVDFIGHIGRRQWHIPENDVLPCPAELNAESADGRKHTVHLHDPRIIGRGHFGIVYEVTATVVGVGPLAGEAAEHSLDGQRRRGHTFPAVIKVFNDERDASTAHRNYDICRDAGLRVLPTYRCDSKQGVMIMTDLGRGEAYAISGNNWSIGAEILETHNIQRIPNWENILEKLFTDEHSEVRKASAHEIELREDVYFFVTPKGTNAPEIGIYAGDFDAISHPVTIGYDRLLIRNVLAVRTSCEQFVRSFVAREHQQAYLRTIDDVCRDLLPSGARGVAD